jgi:hypothetical protein
MISNKMTVNHGVKSMGKGLKFGKILLISLLKTSIKALAGLNNGSRK